MPLYVVVGTPGCHYFAHACLVGDYLIENLPDFRFKKIEKFGDDVKEYVITILEENRWSLENYQLPIFWKEIFCTRTEIKKHFIGGMNEFLEHCFDYYGVEAIISTKDLIKIASDDYMLYHKKMSDRLNRYKKIVAIKGCKSSMLEFIISDLPSALDLKVGEIKIRVLDEFYDLFNINGENIEYVQSYEDLLKGADIFIIIEDFSRQNRLQIKWLRRCVLTFSVLAEYINEHGHENLKIILAHPGSTCFTANVLLGYCSKLNPLNVVAVTADEGLYYTSYLSNISGIPVKDMGAPVVWGWPKIFNFVDAKSIVVKSGILEPNSRALATVNYTLPLGKAKNKLRLAKYLVTADTEEEIQKNKDTLIKTLNREPIFGKIRSLLSLLKLWFGNNRDDDSIISLGIYSNGSFGIPPGVIFSQPACLDRNKCWRPFTPYPINNETKTKIDHFTKEMCEKLCTLMIPNTLCKCTNCFFISNDRKKQI